jgi:hypothetical protein
MTAESIFRAAFWVLLGGVFVMRVYFSLRVRQAGERLTPDRAAIEREGRGMFAGRVVAFFFLIALLVLYALDPLARVPREERMMLEEFGEEYEAYM